MLEKWVIYYKVGDIFLRIFAIIIFSTDIRQFFSYEENLEGFALTIDADLTAGGKFNFVGGMAPGKWYG